MWMLTRSQWKVVNKRNKQTKLVQSLTRATLLKFSKELNSRNNFSEQWFDKLVLSKENSNPMKPIVLRKNYPIANRYFADYFYMEKSIAIEIDDSSHRPDYDKYRDEVFRTCGIIVHRIKFNDLLMAEKIISLLTNAYGTHLVIAKSQNEIPQDSRSINEQVFMRKKYAPKRETERKKPRYSDRQLRVMAANRSTKPLLKLRKQILFDEMMLQGLKK